MNWGLGNHNIVRTGIKQSLSQAYQVWCPYVAQAPRAYAKKAQATSLAAPSYAPGGSPIGCTLLPDDADDPDSHSRAEALQERPSIISVAETPQGRTSGSSDADADGVGATSSRHVSSGALDDSDAGVSAGRAGEAGVSAAPCRGHAQPLTSHCAGPDALDLSALSHTRPPADRTAEASSSGSSSRLDRFNSCSSRQLHKDSAGSSGTAAPGSGGSSFINGISNSRGQPSPAAARPSRRSGPGRGSQGAATGGSARGSGGDGGGGGPAASTDKLREAISPATSSVAPAAIGATASCADGIRCQAAAPGRQPGTAVAALPPRQPLTLERLRDQADALRAFDLEVLQRRLVALCGLLKTDQSAVLQLCRVVPGLLTAESDSLERSWRRLCVSLGGEEPARGAAVTAPLLLVLPSDRVPSCVASLVAATALPPAAAAALVAEWPQIATHAPASLAAKLEGLRRLLGPPPAALRSALRAAPRLLTFSTSALFQHHAELTALLGSPERLRAALSREPGLLLQRPAAVAAKLALLRHLMDCGQQPGAVAALVVRAPGLLRRSLAALSAGCRALSIWQFRRRDKLRMCLSRPGLLALPPAELHGRCRWVRRLMLSNAYYHAALRRLPPSLVAVVVAALPQAWARLQYLAESSQECRMCVMDAVECRQEDFEARFPEFGRWLQFKVKVMGAENPWRGTLRIRGFNTVREKPPHGAPNQVNLLQRQQRQHVVRRPHNQRQQQHAPGPSVSVVLAEAGEVRSGGSTVSRPRRILRQPLTGSGTQQPHAAPAAPPPPPPPPAPPPPPPQDAAQPLVDGLGVAPAVPVFPTVGRSEGTPATSLTPPPLPAAAAGARRRLPGGVREIPAAVPAAAAAAAAAAEVPR